MCFRNNNYDDSDVKCRIVSSSNLINISLYAARNKKNSAYVQSANVSSIKLRVAFKSRDHQPKLIPQGACGKRIARPYPINFS